MIAVLFARADSYYKTLPECDVWDAERDARKWPGGSPVIAHPPCRAWGSLRAMAKPAPGEKRLALYAINQVRLHGGVLEHPRMSRLWPEAKLPAPNGERDAWGGWTLALHQHWLGHRAEKATLLYIVGCEPQDVPPLPLRLDKPTHVVTNKHGLRSGDPGYRKEITKSEREATPPAMAEWLVDLASRCKGYNAK